MTDNNKGRPVISADGLAKLEEELSYYKLVKRKEIAEQIKTAIAFGDLSENAEYDEAKNEQARIEGHISSWRTCCARPWSWTIPTCPSTRWAWARWCACRT